MLHSPSRMLSYHAHTAGLHSPATHDTGSAPAPYSDTNCNLRRRKTKLMLLLCHLKFLLLTRTSKVNLVIAA